MQTKLQHVSLLRMWVYVGQRRGGLFFVYSNNGCSNDKQVSLIKTEYR